MLAKLDAHFATSALHGSLYEFEDLLGVTFVNEHLITFMSNWDTPGPRSPQKTNSWSRSSIDRSRHVNQSLMTSLCRGARPFLPELCSGATKKRLWLKARSYMLLDYAGKGILAQVAQEKRKLL